MCALKDNFTQEQQEQQQQQQQQNFINLLKWKSNEIKKKEILEFPQSVQFNLIITRGFKS